MKKFAIFALFLSACTSNIVEVCEVEDNFATCSAKTSQLSAHEFPRCNEPSCVAEYFDYADGPQYHYHVQVVETCSNGEVNVWVEVHCPDDMILRNGECLPC